MLHALAIVALTASLSGNPGATVEPVSPAGEQAKPKPAAPAKPAPKPKPAAAPAEPPKPEPPPPPPPPTDVRIKTSVTHGAQVSQNTTYLQGPRQRVEFPGLVTIDQCDLKQTVMINQSARKIRVQAYPEPAAAAPAAPAVDPQAQAAQALAAGQKPPRGGVVTMMTTLTDTLERQTMFGLEARRVKTLVLKQATAGACDKSSLRVEVDAWYVDLPQQNGCTRPPAAPPAAPAADPAACVDRIERRAQGDVKLGFPIKMSTITVAGDGDSLETSTSGEEVTELEITRLDRALFEVPDGFGAANSSAEIVPALANGGSLADALFGSTADGTSQAAPKKPGVIRIGVLEPLNKTARTMAASTLRHDLVSKFNKAPYEAIPLKGSSAGAIEQEAARLQCDYLMLTEITEAKTSKPGKMGGLMKFTGSGPPKDSHEVKLDYKLYAVGATQSPKLSGNAKASSGGFGVGSALQLAAFAGQMYVGAMTGGMGIGMMNPLAAVSGTGGLGAMAGGFYDPRAMAMTSVVAGMGGAMMTGMGGASGMPDMADPSEAGMRQTVSEALGTSAKAAMEQLAKKK